MARKRLILTDAAAATVAPGSAGGAGVQTGGIAPPFAAPSPARPAPIAQVAGDSAAMAALTELSAEMENARASGRMIQALPLAAVDEGWLHRDRIAVDPEEMADLVASLRDRGQQAPIEVATLEGGRYGLISGWRRLSALRQLQAETGAPRFATVLAILRRPDTAADAYRAMVEENEIRAGLSYYERARIAALAAGVGAYPDPRSAIAALFATASKAKRSKIGSFLTLHKAIGPALRFAPAIPERLGLRLAAALEADSGLAARLRDRLRKAAPEAAGQELQLLTRALSRSPAAEEKPSGRDEIRPGLWLESGPGRLVLAGKALDGDLRGRLIAWLRENG